ncbi:hypothetical protein BDF22DRAFT_667853 [Syncephalis plumigaleata]|nr:hypothetical protein BDF22DRAFT_667853 [Syncephalis plumigaleata]
MRSLPIPVITSLMSFADVTSIVLLAASSRWLWSYIGEQQQYYWQYQYKQRYTLKDKNEVQWLTWYIRTIHAANSRPVSRHESRYNYTNRGVNKQHHNINWFHAFCHRRATEARWFQKRGYLLQSIETSMNDIAPYVVLQRVYCNHRQLHEFDIIEQCLPLNKPINHAFWRARKVYCSKTDAKLYVRQLLMSDQFTVAMGKHMEEKRQQQQQQQKEKEEISKMLIWPTNRLFNLSPRIIFYPCNEFVEINGRWLLLCCTEKDHDKTTNKTTLWTTVRVLDLATGRMCGGFIKKAKGRVFLQRTSNDAAIVLYAAIRDNGPLHVINWSLWRFSLDEQPNHGPCCLMTGECTLSNTKLTFCPVQVLDEHRFLVRHLYNNYAESIPDELPQDLLSLAVISTHYNKDIDEAASYRRPVWQRNVHMVAVTPLLSHHRIIAASDQGWTSYNMNDGTVLSHVSMDILASLLGRYIPEMKINSLIGVPFWIPGIVFCSGKESNSTIIVDLIQPKQSKKLEIMNATDKLATEPILCTRNMFLVNHNNKREVIDLAY